MSKITIAVDMDEVLCHFVPKLIEFHNDTYSTDIQFEKFHNYAFHKVWGGSPEETQEKMNLFFQSKHFQSLERVKGSYESLKLIKDTHSCRMVIVTSRQLFLRDATESFLNAHFPGSIFDEILMGNHYGETGEKLSKSEMCLKVGASILIDDSLLYANECAKNGIKTILFGNYPWNQSERELHNLVKRVEKWDEIVSYIDDHVKLNE